MRGSLGLVDRDAFQQQFGRAPYWQPQPPVPHAQPPEEAPASLAASFMELAPFDLVRALKTESCSAARLLAHFGHETARARESTMRSYRLPQSSQMYSYIGIAKDNFILDGTPEQRQPGALTAISIGPLGPARVSRA